MAEEQRCVYPLEKINNTYLRWKREVAGIFLKVAKEESFKAVCFKDFFFHLQCKPATWINRGDTLS